MTLINNTKNKTNKNKASNKSKQNNYLVCNPQHSFARFEDIDNLKELSFDSKHKRINDFKIRFNRLKTFSPQTDENKNLQEKVLGDAGDIFNKLYYVYKDKYSEENDGLTTKH